MDADVGNVIPKLHALGMNDIATAITKERLMVLSKIASMGSALRLVLMFYRGGSWTNEMRDEWMKITGSDEATTRVMCDHIRKVLDG